MDDQMSDLPSGHATIDGEPEPPDPNAPSFDNAAAAAAAATMTIPHGPLHHGEGMQSKRCGENHTPAGGECPLSGVSPKRRRRRHRRRRTEPRISSSTSSSAATGGGAPRCSNKFFLMCGCVYLLSATGGTADGGIPSDGGGGDRERRTRFLRSGAAAAVSAAAATPADATTVAPKIPSLDSDDGDPPPSATSPDAVGGPDAADSLSSADGGGSGGTKKTMEDGRKKAFLRRAAPTEGASTVEDISDAEDESADDESSSFGDGTDSSTSTIPAVTEPSLIEEGFDYETYHHRHNIPIPALGATMMGAVNPLSLRTTTTTTNNNDDAPRLRHDRSWGGDDNDDAPFMQRGGGIMAFAGTSQAMKMFASDVDDDAVAGDGLLPDDDPPLPLLPPPVGNKKLLAFAGTSDALNEIASETNSEEDDEDDENLLYMAAEAHLGYANLVARAGGADVEEAPEKGKNENLLYKAAEAHLHYANLMDDEKEIEEEENLLYKAAETHLHYANLMNDEKETEEEENLLYEAAESHLHYTNLANNKKKAEEEENLLYKAAVTHLHYTNLMEQMEGTDDDDDDGIPSEGEGGASKIFSGGEDGAEDMPPGNSLGYESTLALISKSRSSLLWGSDRDDDDEDVANDGQRNDTVSDAAAPRDDDDEVANDRPRVDIVNVTTASPPKRTKTRANKNDSSNPPALCQFSLPCSSSDSNSCQYWLPCPKSQKRTDNDLDRGRHLVGLEVREVRPHQQIIVDSQQDVVATSMEELEYLDYGAQGEDVDGAGPTSRPLRIKFLLAENARPPREGGDDAKRRHDNLLLTTLLSTSFARAADFYSRALSPTTPVAPGAGIAPTVETCGSARVPPAHRAEGVPDADVVVYVSGDDGFCGGALLHAATCDYDQNMRPLVANVNVCVGNLPPALVGDMLNRAADGGAIGSSAAAREYDGYVAAETARVLGASTSFFRHYRNPDTETPYGTVEKVADCVDGTQETIEIPNVIGENIDQSTGMVYYELRTPKVTEVVRNHFDCMTMTGARLDVKQGGISCFGGFLDDRLFFGEQTSGFQMATTPKNQGLSISPLTLALLEDSSWYVADYTMSTEMSFGRGAGCQFSHGGCTLDEDGAVHAAPQNEGFHCSDIGSLGCDVSHSFKARCDLLHPTTVASQHDLLGGSSARNEVCPMYIRGAIDCSDDDGIPPSSRRPGEAYGESSKCFQTEEGEPMCLLATCDEETQRVDVRYDDETFSCLRDGQIIDTDKGVRIVCPRMAAVCASLVCPSNCSGRGVCDEDRDGKHACICDDPFDETPGCWGT